MATEELRLHKKTNGLVLLLCTLAAVASLVGVFRPRAPSPYSEGSGYGPGHGSDSIMFGADPRGDQGR